MARKKKTVTLDDRVEASGWEGLLKLDGHDDACVGVVTGFGGKAALCYNRTKVLDKLRQDGMTEEEAVEYFEYNIIGAYVGETTPMFLEPLPEEV